MQYWAEFFLLVIEFQNCYQVTSNRDSDFYIAGVVDFSPPEREHSSPQNYIATNLKAYLDFMSLAKAKDVDILVFPEATLNYFSTRERLLENAIVTPNPNDEIAPWQHEQYSEVLKTLSKKCHDLQMYVLVNLVEKVSCGNEQNPCRRAEKENGSNFNLFNTNIVFDRQGKVISKYQKYNLFLEIVDAPLTPQYAVFNTDFGVKFGHFICFDILFKEPAMTLLSKENVTHILYPSMWYSDLPHLTGVEVHQGWAFANNVNLISAGANVPSEGNGGSGIFIGRRKIPTMIISPEKTSTLLVSQIPKNIESTDLGQLPENHHRFPAVRMQRFHLTEEWADLDGPSFNIEHDPQTVCAYDDICCTYRIKIKNPGVIEPRMTVYKYRIVANYTVRNLGDRSVGEFYCSVIACTSNNPKTCGRRFKTSLKSYVAVEFESVEIIAKIRHRNPDDIITMPNTLDTSILPLDISKYVVQENIAMDQKGFQLKEFKIASKEKLKDILTFGIYGRNFAMDAVI